MNETEGSIGIALVIVMSIILGVILFFIIFADPITKVLDNECKEQDMEYLYREGPNCLDEDNVIHPIAYSDCGIFIWNQDTCKIRFVERLGR